jgi:ABC-2 type transport system ATP-binding protein
MQKVVFMSAHNVLLDVSQVSIRRGARTVIDKLDLQVCRAEVIAVFGDNGSGKSTLLAAIAGITPPYHGQISVQMSADTDLDVWGSARAQHLARAALGYVPENADPPGFLTAAELIALAATCRGTSWAAQQTQAAWQHIVKALDIEPLFETRIEHMSLGQRRRACIAAALIGAPPLLVLDEPDNGLDAARLAAVTDLLIQHVANAGAVVLATHDRSFADGLRARTVWLAAQTSETP